jgi:undecaprenyl diphosphate synthase
MDGNGRWAEAQGLPRGAGHRAGAIAVHRVVRSAPGLGVSTLTLFALSADNWKRPPPEIDGILDLLREYLSSETPECIANGVRLRVIGRRDRLPTELVLAIEAAEQATRAGTKLLLRLAIDYSSRDAIVTAARAFNVTMAANGARDGFAHLLAGELGPEAPARGLTLVKDPPPSEIDTRRESETVETSADRAPAPAPSCEVDLLIRSGGEQRLSDFLLWESAYAEIVFTKRMWPEFDGVALRKAIQEFRARERRFGDVDAPGSERQGARIEGNAIEARRASRRTAR